jgi:dihydroorotate dehydrogenase (fumarate)
LTAVIGGVRLSCPVMNAAGTWSGTADELAAVARSGAGAVVLRPTTLHPFLHPEFRSLHNPGYDRYLPLLAELAAFGKPLVATIAGAAVEEYVALARAFAEAGAHLLEVDLADPYVEATLAPWEDAGALARMLATVRAAAGRPILVRCPERVPLPLAELGRVLVDAGADAVILVNTFAVMEKFCLASSAPTPAVVALGGVASGYELASALRKGATAVQLTTALAVEGPRIFARITREYETVREKTPSG